MVDRTGAKVTLQEKLSRNSTGLYGLVAEQVSNLDENMMLVSRAARTLPTGSADVGGPPTSLSTSGKDRLVFLLANFTRDTTHFLNGTQLGDRQIYQVRTSHACTRCVLLLCLLCLQAALVLCSAVQGDNMPADKSGRHCKQPKIKKGFQHSSQHLHLANAARNL